MTSKQAQNDENDDYEIQFGIKFNLISADNLILI